MTESCECPVLDPDRFDEVLKCGAPACSWWNIPELSFLIRPRAICKDHRPVSGDLWKEMSFEEYVAWSVMDS